MRKSDSTAWKVGLLVAVVVSAVAIGVMSMMRAPLDPAEERAKAKREKERSSSTSPDSDTVLGRGPKMTHIAQITDAAGCEWAEQRQFAQGERLEKGDEIDLLKGQAKIKFESGAHVILEGPAKFKLVSTTSGELKAGKMVADVPDDVQEFTIATPTARIVDADFNRAPESEGTPDKPQPVRLGKGESRRLGAGESIRID